MKAKTLRLASLFVAMSLATGCQKAGPPRSLVVGSVSYHGQPLTIGEVAFHPADGGAPSRSAVQRNGTYRMTEVLAGRYRVTVATPQKPRSGQKASLRPNAPTPVYVPSKFSQPETSGISVEVAATDTTIDIQLND